MKFFNDRKKISSFIISFLLVFAMAGSSFGALTSLPTSKNSNPIVSIFKNASTAVVNIDVEKTARRNFSPFPFDDDPIFKHFFGDSFKDFTRSVPMKGRGSGFIVTKDGQILTNNHVVDGVDKITVSVLLADGSKKTYPARILGNDPAYDIAVIKIEPDETLPVLELGNSDELEVGEFVVAIGNPYGFEHSVTAGVISAKNRSIHAQDINFDDFLQTDAAINPGNSGGPLLDMDGKVIGINTAIIPYAQGLGFAIPVNRAKEVMGDLVSYGRVKRGWLGVSIQKVTPEIAKAYGVKGDGGAIVGDVFKDSAAEKGGLKRGDVVIEINGEKVKDVDWFVQKVRTLQPGTTANLKVIRKKREITLKIKLDERPNTADGRVKEDDERDSDKKDVSGKTSDALKDFGIDEVSLLNNSLKRKYKLDSKTEGIVVTKVNKESVAAMSGIKEGDLLLEVNGYEVKKIDDISTAINKNDKSLILMLERENATFILQVTKNDD